ncbi:MAG: hypothetical protein IID39_05730 [Planctomycetes bacterium]|nr:hypothetical protein [Planctomycetota bacterium]
MAQWGYIPDLPPDDPEFRTVANGMADIIRGVHGRNYVGGPVYTTLYPASGISIDWVYGELGILSYTFELRGNDFVIPPEEILPNAEEIFPAMLFLTDWVTTAVQISYPDGRPTIIEPGVEVEMRVDISAAAEEVDPDGATLHVRTESGGEFTSYAIEHVGGDEFLATFPARGCGDDTEFYVTAMGELGGIAYSPPGAPEQFYSAQVGTLATFFEDDFEADQGWTVENIDLQDGPWERGVPVGGGDRSDPPTDFDGSGSCYLTDNVDDNSDVDGGPTRLISPVFDLSDAVDPQLSYARWFQSVNGVPDQMDVEISDDNGSSWELIERVNSGGGWTVQIVRIKDFVTPTAQVRVRFSAVDNPNDSVTEAAIDAFSIFDLQCDAEPLSIVHGNPEWDRNDAKTWMSFNDWSYGGYIDPKFDSNNGNDVNLGLDTFNVVFSGEPFGDAVGGPVTLANVSVEVTGGAVPNITGVVKNGDTLTVQLDRILTPQEWTTLVFDLYDSDGVRIIDNGNEGEGADEAARLDVGFMPGDVNNNGATQPQDLSRWIRSWNDGNPIFPVDVSNGHPDDYLDISRGDGTQPQDLSRVIQLLSGTGDATQVWNGLGMNSARP